MSLRKNIVFVIDSPFPYYAGGIETWLYNISGRLCKDHNVIIVSEKKNLYTKSFFELNKNIKVVNYITLNNIRFIRKICRGPLQFIRQIGRIRSIEKAIKSIVIPDNSFYHIIALTTLYAAKATLKIRNNYANVCYICSARCPHAELTTNKTPFLKHYYEKLEKENLSNADVALSNGYDTINYFNQKGILTSLMKNGVDLKRFEYQYDCPKELNANDFNVISVATLLDIKGIKEMISAIAILHKRGHDNIKLTLIGKGGQDKYRKIVQEHGVEDSISMIGHRSNVVPYLQYANVVCCLSGGSGLSMSALEAMASEKIVIAWDTPVYQQFNSNQKTMLLVEEKNIVKLADTIENIYLDPLIYEQIAKNASNEAKKYDWDIVTADLLNYLK